MKMIDLDKPLQTRDGRQVRIYATDGYGDYPLHGAFLREEGWHKESWTAEGKYVVGEDNEWDIINVKTKHIGYAALLEDEDSHSGARMGVKLFNTEKELEQDYSSHIRKIIKIIEVEWEE